MGKIGDKFQELKRIGQKAFIPYLPYGYPTADLTKKCIFTAQSCGVDMIELGIPFSDPLADGPILQEASRIALENGATVEGFFIMLEELQGRITVPIIVMTYYNPVLQYGVRKFLARAAKYEVGGIIIVDLPIEEAQECHTLAAQANIDTIYFITPNTPKKRAVDILSLARGFIYYISVTGITGPHDLMVADIKKHIREIKSFSNIPVCVGFGIHTPEQVLTLSSISDGVIVGSALVKYITQQYRKTNFLVSFAKMLRTLSGKNEESPRNNL